MKFEIIFLLASLAVGASSKPVDDVDGFMGTSNSRWMMFPGPTLPFGLVKLSPDNQGDVWNGGSEYTVGNISGFSHLNVFDPQVRFIRRRHADGSWVEPFDAFHLETKGGWNRPGFVEGAAWIYTGFVPHDLPGLVELLGADQFNARLEEGFAKGYEDLGSEPNLQAPFLFNYSGKPWLTQKCSRVVLRDYFEESPYTGGVGEEDEGQLCAYYVLLAMGLFEMKGGCEIRPSYDLSSPLFDRVVIHLDANCYSGKTFTLEAQQNSTNNLYIQSAALNGRPLNEARLFHDRIIKGGRLSFNMGPKPNQNWGRNPALETLP